jgi:predicted PolB exonuclease-like 3'-5' exonuclease
MSGTEKEMLQKFWGLAAGVQQFIGHNIWGFDMPFILQRSMVNGVKPLPINFRRYMKEPLYDTMLEWTFWNFDREKNPRLDTLAKVFGLPTSKDEMDGSMVWPYFQKGRIDEICKYCMKDVELTRKVYYKMIVEQVPFEEISTPDDIQF